MPHLLVRKSDGQRFLPAIEPNLYSPNGSGETPVRPGRALLALAYPQLTWQQRHAGRGLSPIQQLARLLLLHRLAFEAELAGEFERADFFWRECNSQLRAASTRLDIWEAACAALEQKSVTSPEIMRDLIVNELFIDTHIAFANGQLAKVRLDPDDRAFVHLAFLRTLLEVQKVQPAEAALLLGPAIEAEMEVLQTAKRWDEAIARAGQYLALSPDDVASQERLALLHFRHALDRAPSKGDEISDAKWLDRKIEVLERTRSANPDWTMIYSLLAQLYQLQSIRLANGGRLADALVASRKAHVFAPTLDVAVETMSQLVENMNNLQAQMKAVESQLRAAGNMTLNAEGVRLQAEARRGFAPLDEYIKSEHPEQIAAARQRANARTLWQDIGLQTKPQPADEELLKLFVVVGELYGSERTDIADIAAAFRDKASSEPVIADLAISAEAIAAFIMRRRRENASQPETERGAAPAHPVPEAAAAFSIPGPDKRVRQKPEPLWFWLFGTQDPGYRLLAAAAAVAAIAVLGVSLADRQGSRAKSQAYSAITTAAGPDREKIIAAEAQRFLDAWTLQQNDLRIAQVQALRRDALELPNRRIRDAAFEQLRQAVQGNDDAAAIDAAERFLDAPPLQIADPRREVVLDAYARAFSIWFSNLPEPLSETALARIQSYRKLASAMPNGGKNP
ncbi:hypothetical protein ABID58_006703 [Bradyrhizobium sp. S3.2.6]|uniref:hypothetical protein n=1 Tax=Bradyrhizobium sp. S3.2.6 TaxID=3156428 RepID=UPI00339B6C80